MIQNFSQEQYGENFREHILEVYKIYVEMADRVSQRRFNTNTFFVSVNTFLLSIVTFFGNSDYFTFSIIAVAGIIFAFAWYFLLDSYRKLNSQKFKVIQTMETFLPLSPYTDEWHALGNGKKKRLYWPVSRLEAVLPLLMGVLYLGLLLYSLFTLRTMVSLS